MLGLLGYLVVDAHLFRIAICCCEHGLQTTFGMPTAPKQTHAVCECSSLNHGADVFAKIKGMISDMIEKLEKEQAEDKELKQWCDEEIVESIAKKEDCCHLREAQHQD